MGQLRPEDDPEFARFLVRVSLEAWKEMRTPPAQLSEPEEPPPPSLHEDPFLLGEAVRCRSEAIAEGRATPRPRSPSPPPIVPPEGLTSAETPESLEQYKEAGAARARARLARIAERSIASPDGSSHETE